MGLLTFFIRFWQYLPWVAIGLMAMVSLRKQKESKGLLLQAGGAGSMFLLGMLRWFVIEVLMAWMNGSQKFPKIRDGTDIIFQFLLFLALLSFAAGYCAERFARRKPAEVTATRIDQP